MNMLVEKSIEKWAGTREQAKATYRELLARADDPQPGDTDQLAAAMNLMELSQADLEEHAAVLTKVGALQVALPTEEQIEAAWAAGHQSKTEAMGKLRLLIQIVIAKLGPLELPYVFDAAWRAYAAPDADRAALLMKSNELQGVYASALQAPRGMELAREETLKKLARLKAENPLLFD